MSDRTLFSESSRDLVRMAGLLWLAVSMALPMNAQEVASGPPLETGWHLVRPGETLQSVTAFYLGSSARWEENWRLNPELADPHRIFPGQRLRILLPRPLPERTARLVEVSHRVDDRLRPSPWAEALKDDLLRPQDGVRTFERSSAELAFGDGTRLQLTEQSLVFLWGGATEPAKLERKSIEVIEGQADLEAKAAPAGAAGIEIVIGDTTAKPRPTPGGGLQTRARRPDAGGAQLMVYGGESELEAGGRKLTVPQGMGSNVPVGAPPSPPEKLLPAAVLDHPASEGQLALADLGFRWQPVEGASSYTVEVCGDSRCSRLIAKTKQLAQPTWQAAELPLGALFWRVTAVSPSGLDGYPSQALGFETVTELARAEPAPPVPVALRWVGPQTRCSGALVVGPGARPVLEPATAVASWRLILDGQELAPAQLAAALTAGEHEIMAIALDGEGRPQQLPPLAFIYDPDPPVIAWGRVGGSELGSSSESSDASEPATLSSALSSALSSPVSPELEWRTGSSGWIEAGHRSWHYFADKPWIMLYGERGWWPRVRQGWRLKFEQPRIELRSHGGPVALGGAGATLEGGESLWIEAREGACRVETLGFRVTGRATQDPQLQLDATDSVGNRTHVVWPLTGRR